MGFGFSSMPSAQQRAMQTMGQLPDAQALALAARQSAMGGGAGQPPPQPGAAPGGGAGAGMNLPMPQHMPPVQPYNPSAIQMPSASAGIPTQTPWTPGGVNIPAQYTGASFSPAAGAGESEAGASFLSDIAALFGG